MESEDYPRTLAELEARFSSEEACREYLFQLRWPDGFRCPRCGAVKAWPLRSGRWQCAGFGHQVSATTGTVFQDTRTPLTVWFRAIWLMTSQKNGISALGLQQVLGWGSYQTAWTCFHKLRRAMIRPGRERLLGTVEVGVRGRQTETKALIVAAAEEDGKGIGRIRLRHIPDASASSLLPFVQDSIAPGSTVHTDGWLGYLPLEANGYPHRITYLKGRKEQASELLPRVHQVISLVKRWLLETDQGAVREEHLQDYLDEFTFRFNRRRSRSRGKLFYRLVQQAVASEATTYKEFVASAHLPASADHNPLGLPESDG
jgi:transposase-like protein